MEIFILPALGLAAVVVLFCLVCIRSAKGPNARTPSEEDRQRRLERSQERFYRQQSWMFWRDLRRGGRR